MSARATGVALGIEQGGHFALSAMLTVFQLSKSFDGRALFDDVSLQVNRGDRIGPKENLSSCSVLTQTACMRQEIDCRMPFNFSSDAKA